MLAGVGAGRAVGLGGGGDGVVRTGVGVADATMAVAGAAGVGDAVDVTGAHAAATSAAIPSRSASGDRRPKRSIVDLSGRAYAARRLATVSRGTDRGRPRTLPPEPKRERDRTRM
jgi:hypothetical protein